MVRFFLDETELRHKVSVKCGDASELYLALIANPGKQYSAVYNTQICWVMYNDKDELYEVVIV